MGIWKKEATHCRRCDVEFDGTNKYKKRAVCKDCQKIEWAERMAKKKVGAVNYHQLYDEIKIEKRKHIHEEINKQLKATTTTEERRAFLSNRFNEIQNDELLWRFLSRNTQRSK